MTIKPLEQTIGKCEPLRPQWFRIPDAVAVSGIGRSLLYRHLTAGNIKSVCLRDPSNARGIRLVNVDSLFAFIESFGNEGASMGEANRSLTTPKKDKLIQ